MGLNCRDLETLEIDFERFAKTARSHARRSALRRREWRAGARGCRASRGARLSARARGHRADAPRRSCASARRVAGGGPQGHALNRRAGTLDQDLRPAHARGDRRRGECGRGCGRIRVPRQLAAQRRPRRCARTAKGRACGYRARRRIPASVPGDARYGAGGDRARLGADGRQRSRWAEVARRTAGAARAAQWSGACRTVAARAVRERRAAARASAPTGRRRRVSRARASWCWRAVSSPANVGEAVRAVRPFGVDVSSGVEKPPRREGPGADSGIHSGGARGGAGPGC